MGGKQGKKTHPRKKNKNDFLPTIHQFEQQIFLQVSRAWRKRKHRFTMSCHPEYIMGVKTVREVGVTEFFLRNIARSNNALKVNL
jgi:hypothetical protein